MDTKWYQQKRRVRTRRDQAPPAQGRLSSPPPAVTPWETLSHSEGPLETQRPGLVLGTGGGPL